MGNPKILLATLGALSMGTVKHMSIKSLILPFSFAMLSVAGFFEITSARDAGQFGQVSSEIKAWIEHLKDDAGVPCCAMADGQRPEEVDWDIDTDHYRVKLDGKWHVVPNGAVLKTRNRLGYALVWYHYEFDAVTIRCFVPGNAS
jgi:hypothetical protein